MSNLDDRIRALDPFADAPYEHADAASMVERVTTAAPPRSRRRRALLLVPASAVAAAGLVAGGLLVTAGTAAPSLSALHVTEGGARHTVFAPSPTALRLDGRQFTYMASRALSTDVQPLAPIPSAYTYLYQLASPLPTATPQLSAYQVLTVANPAGALAASATTLRVKGVVTRVATSTWHLGTEAGARGVATLFRSPSGLYDLQFLRPDVARRTSRCATGEIGAVDTDRFAMSASLASLLSSLGLHYQLAGPTFETSWSRAPGARCTGFVVLGATILVHGVVTDQLVQVAFDPTGRIAAASLPVFAVGRSAPYPLVSPATAAGAVVRSSATFGAPEHRPGSAGTPTASQHAQGDVAGASLMVVELRTASIALRAFATSSGTWFLPVYVLGGDGYTNGASSTTLWSGNVVAAAAPLVRLTGVADTQSRVFDERTYTPIP